MTAVPAVLYLVSAILFTVGIKRLSQVRTARQGNQLAAVAMLLAVIGTLLELGLVNPLWIVIGLVVGGGIGAWLALRVEMTEMPELVALFNGSGGASSALVALASYAAVGRFSEPAYQALTTEALPGGVQAGVLVASVVIGGITLTGSLVAWGKLNGKLKRGQPITLPGRHVINGMMVAALLGTSVWFALAGGGLGPVALGVVTGLAMLLGVLLVIPIGGADMPVVVSLLNSYSGVAAAAAGFVVGNPVLVVAGAMVGAAGLILTNIMCVAMNRSLLNVLVGGFGDAATAEDARDYVNIKSAGPEEAAMMLDIAESVIVVPGYGLAVAQAQHIVREMADLLIAKGVHVAYAIHPVAGRMPGHMNVLLAEADVPYEQLFDLEQISDRFKTTDVVLVVGANDVVNPAALDEPDSPIAGMPILPVHEARTVMVIKRSLSPGYAGIKNKLFERDNTLMLFGDAKKMLQGMVSELKELG